MGVNASIEGSNPSFSASLPAHWLQGRADDVSVVGARLVEIVREVPRIPDDDILILDRLTVDPRPQVRRVGRADRDDTVVDLPRVVAKEPDVAARERPVGRRGREAVVLARDDVVGLARDAVLDAPFPLSLRCARARSCS